MPVIIAISFLVSSPLNEKQLQPCLHICLHISFNLQWKWHCTNKSTFLQVFSLLYYYSTTFCHICYVCHICMIAFGTMSQNIPAVKYSQANYNISHSYRIKNGAAVKWLKCLRTCTIPYVCNVKRAKLTFSSYVFYT